MKISSLLGSLGYSYKVRDKQDSGSSFQQKGDQQKSGKDQNSDDASDSEADYEKVDQAVEAFQSDAQTQANGLSASVEGKGPGLKIVLKDGSGSVVRQFTGEEFLKLRQAVSKDGTARGKILDQKL